MNSLSISTAVIEATTSDALADHRGRGRGWNSETQQVPHRDLTDEALTDLAAAAVEVGDASFGRVVQSIQQARVGQFKAIPSLRAAAPVMVEFLRAGMIDGWLYVRGSDGHLHPYLVTDIGLRETRNDDKPFLAISLFADDPSERKGGRDTRTLTFSGSDVARKKPADVLLASGALKETVELKEAYLDRFASYQRVINTGFAQQFRYTGMPLRKSDDYRQPNRLTRAKVIHDIAPTELRPISVSAPSILHGPDGSDAVGPVPVRTALRVFDLGAQEFLDVNATDLTAYKYDKTLRDKLILPADQRELLDILTTDISTFVGDIVDGKSAGNVIMAKGKPGVGKTLTAEVYSEVIERPLYAIHSGSLGVEAPEVRKNLETVFQRAKRWDAVLLLDEADVFVLERGANIVQNAIVAEFLRTLEYFDGLLFMTTNRADNIDDAILSRCAAIIDYKAPSAEDASKVWRVLAANQDESLADALVDELVDGFPDITPRDQKMLLRLALRVAAHRHEPLTVDVFARCAMFRGLHYQSAGRLQEIRS
jgi:hypothetical protein